MLRRLTAAFALCLAASSANAQVVGFTNTTGLMNPGSVIRFDEMPTAPWRTTNEYAGFGVSFSPYVFHSFGRLSNWDYGLNLDWVEQFTFKLESPVSAAALQMTGGSFLLTAYLENTAVASQLFGGSDYLTSWEYAGFQALSGESFDRVKVAVAHYVTFGDFDNLQFTVTREPGTSALLAFGLLAIGIVSKDNFRRKKLGK